jgi:multimeric flavodoxin WrbA
MKVLLVNGGPHKDGCTNLALEEVANTLNREGIETEIIWLGVKPIGGCIACNQCLKNNNRCFMDDVVNEFLDKAEKADGFVFGSPVHFAGASGNITSFLDRVFYGRGNLFKGKVCSSVVSCRRGGATATFDQLNKYALMSNMYIVGSSYWNQIHGTNKEEASQDLEGLQTMRNLAKNMAYVLKCIEIGNKNGVSKPDYEKPIKTNFISVDKKL